MDPWGDFNPTLVSFESGRKQEGTRYFRGNRGKQARIGIKEVGRVSGEVQGRTSECSLEPEDDW